MNDKIYIGIDPGKKGAVAYISNNNLEVYDIPLDFNKKEIDSHLLYDLIYSEILECDSICFIEKAQPMPKQGVTSTFNYGKIYGELIAILKILMIPFQEITSLKWKKEFGLIKKTKKDSIIMAKKLFPQASKDYFIGPRGGQKDGIAEALLIAEYCRRITK